MSDNEIGNSASGAKGGDNIYAGVSNKPIASHAEFETSQYEADSSDDIALKKVTKLVTCKCESRLIWSFVPSSLNDFLRQYVNKTIKELLKGRKRN